ncbi:hypothetical protein K438DRAFT_2063519, partial [Mycena galopus ATCC 62051]
CSRLFWSNTGTRAQRGEAACAIISIILHSYSSILRSARMLTTLHRHRRGRGPRVPGVDELMLKAPLLPRPARGPLHHDGLALREWRRGRGGTFFRKVDASGLKVWGRRIRNDDKLGREQRVVPRPDSHEPAVKYPRRRDLQPHRLHVQHHALDGVPPRATVPLASTRRRVRRAGMPLGSPPTHRSTSPTSPPAPPSRTLPRTRSSRP